MSFSMVCVGQEVLPQPGAFDFAFQRTGVLNSQTLAMEQGDLHFFSLLLGITKNFSAHSLGLSQPETSLLT